MTPANIVKLIYGVSQSEMLSRSRNTRLVAARKLMAWLILQKKPKSYSAAGIAAGRDRASAYYYEKEVRNEMETYTHLRMMYTNAKKLLKS